MTLRKARSAWESYGDKHQSADDKHHDLLVGGGSLVRVPCDRLRRGCRQHGLTESHVFGTLIAVVLMMLVIDAFIQRLHESRSMLELILIGVCQRGRQATLRGTLS